VRACVCVYECVCVCVCLCICVVWVCVCMSNLQIFADTHTNLKYGVAADSRIDKIINLFYKRAL